MNFEDIAPKLFSCSTHNRGICRLDLDEACYLYRLIKLLNKQWNEKTSLQVIELGTYKGGSTLLIASAGAHITTIDNYSSKAFDNYTFDPIHDVDSLLKDFKLDSKVDIIKGDTTSYPNKDMKCDLLFIDGDHSYEGVKADYEHWISTLKDGGSLLFHDSCGKKEGRIRKSEVPKLMPEIPYKKIAEVGSITHFIKEEK